MSTPLMIEEGALSFVLVPGERPGGPLKPTVEQLSSADVRLQERGVLDCGHPRDGADPYTVLVTGFSACLRCLRGETFILRDET
jgi:hypothetical protein